MLYMVWVVGVPKLTVCNQFHTLQPPYSLHVSVEPKLARVMQ